MLAAALAAFGDRTPESEVAEAVERAPAAAQAPSTPARASTQEAKPAPAIARLLPREVLIGDARVGLKAGSRDPFGRQDWTPPPPPPPKPAPPRRPARRRSPLP
ncbi:hypothetical protein [Massilia sp. Se16.2.3]|uniref:hypothetical protein n=1 Tax=Massilia sp. Se16.2.3 TaxID=2709303 RepID=UPI001E651130|nr:hypothetical protein [Massilia sp. Se16.2.3]